MLDGASANLHRVRIAVQPALHGVERVFVLPTPDPAEVGRRAVGLHRANAATVARVAVHYLSVLDSIRASPQDLDWTARRIVVFVGLVVEDEVGLAEASLCLAAGGHEFKDQGLYAGPVCCRAIS